MSISEQIAGVWILWMIWMLWEAGLPEVLGEVWKKIRQEEKK